jgi:hypothetical protein
MKALMVAGVVAAILISATSATAAFVVTSKHIKDGTIQTVDISTKAKRALRGNRGPAGLAGLSELEIVTADGEFDTSLVKAQTAKCPSGKTAVGGGGSVSERGRTVGLTSSRPWDKETWSVTAARFVDVDFLWRLSAYAVCARTN